MGNQPIRKAPAAAALALGAAAALAWGCCDGLSIRLSRMIDFLVGVIDVSAEVSVDVSGSGLVAVAFDGDFAGWADLPAFPADEIATDLTGVGYAGGSASVDMDYDAAREDVALLAAQGGALAAPLVFASWRGDSYTADRGVCWLGWVEGGLARLAASWCGDETGLMYCEMPGSGEGAPACDLCLAETGGCTACDMGGRLKSCLPDRSISGSIDIDIDIDFDHDGDLSLDTDPDGAP